LIKRKKRIEERLKDIEDIAYPVPLSITMAGSLDIFVVPSSLVFFFCYLFIIVFSFSFSFSFFFPFSSQKKEEKKKKKFCFSFFVFPSR